LEEGMPLCNRLLREMHEVLLSRGRGSGKQPGEFRRSQNWIGGTRPGNAFFVPPPPQAVASCMADLERFIHDPEQPYPTLVKAAPAHVQFETIHPFLDGNGRLGRLLISFMLHHEGMLSRPLLYLSLYFKTHRQTYYERLDQVRTRGDWEGWTDFFLEGVEQTALDAVETARRLVALMQEDEQRIHRMGRRAGTALRVHRMLSHRPLHSIRDMASTLKLSYPAVSKSLEALQTLDIVREITGRQRNRIYAYQGFLDILNEGVHSS
jgi:Fic family protein